MNEGMAQLSTHYILPTTYHYDLEFLNEKIVQEYLKWYLISNMDKIKYLCIGDLKDNNLKTDAREKYIYLGTKIDTNERNERDRG